MKEINFNDQTYVLKSDLNIADNEEWFIFRTYSSGVYFGQKERVQDSIGHFICDVNNARRIRYWDGGVGLDTIAEKGICPSKLENCKFGPFLSKVLRLPNVVEIIPCSDLLVKQIKAADWNKEGREDD